MPLGAVLHGLDGLHLELGILPLQQLKEDADVQEQVKAVVNLLLLAHGHHLLRSAEGGGACRRVGRCGGSDIGRG